MWASYAAWPSASVSTRSIVPPLTFASAAARTFAAVSPVRSVSSGRWGGSPAWFGGSLAGACGRADGVPLLLLDPPLPDAAPAIADPPSASAVTDRTISSRFLTLSLIGLLSVGDERTSPGDQRDVRTR